MQPYTTGDEIKFLQGLGSHRKPAAYERTPREYLAALLDYLKTMPQRGSWGDIDPEKVAKWIGTEQSRVLGGGEVPVPAATIED